MAGALTSIKPGGISIAIAFVRQIYLSQLKAASLNSSHAVPTNLESLASTRTVISVCSADATAGAVEAR
jgi:hypothetical protein